MWSLLGFFVAFFIFISLYRISLTTDGLGIILFKGGMGQLSSTQSATVEKWFLEEGDAFKTGDKLVSLRSHLPPFRLDALKANDAAILAEVVAYPGTKVEPGDALAFLSAHGDKRSDLEVIGFVSSLEGKKIHSGMRVSIMPTITNEYRDGILLGEVKRVGKLPVSKAAINSLVKIPELAKYIRSRIEAEPFLVVINLQKDQLQPSGYRWQGRGPPFVLDSGLLAYFRVEYEQKTLLETFWPWLTSWWES